MPAPDCYLCKHRRPIPGDAHSGCANPNIWKHLDCMDYSLFQLAAQNNMPWEKSSIMILGNRSIGIKGNPHGIKNGWFYWPFNFDPLWLEECNGFEAINDKGTTQGNSLGTGGNG